MHHLVELDETRLEMTLIGHRVKISKKNQEESASIEDPNKDQDTNKDWGTRKTRIGSPPFYHMPNNVFCVGGDCSVLSAK